MKKENHYLFKSIILATVCTALLVGCSTPNRDYITSVEPTESVLQENASTNKSEDESIRILPDVEPSNPKDSASTENVPDIQSSTPISFYEKVEDIPFESLSITNEGRIFKNGEAWLGPPSYFVFGEPMYYDSEKEELYVALYAKEDPLQTVEELNIDYNAGVDMFWRFDVNKNVELDTYDHELVPDVEGKVFIGVSGNILVCSDGTGFDTVAWKWVNQ